MAAPTSTNEVTARKLSASISALWAKIKSTFQTLGNLVTAWGSTPSDTKYPSEKLVKTSLDAKAPNAPSEVTIATGDKPLIADSSDSNKVKRASISFDTGVTTTYLCRNGTFNSVKEADVTWGGSFRTELSPAEFGNMARNLIHNPITTAITYEITTDGGTTWTLQERTDPVIRALCNLAGSGAGSQFGLTNALYSGVTDPTTIKGRLTIYAISSPSIEEPEDTWFYGIVKRILVKISRAGDARMKVEYQTWPHFIGDKVWGDVGTFTVMGDSGWNSIPFDQTIGGYSGQLSARRIIALRFTYWIESGASPRIGVIKIGFLPQIHWKSNAGNIPLLGVPISIRDDGKGAIEYANSANKLETARKLAVSLSNTSSDTSFNGTSDVTNIKTTGTLGVGNGGTGKTSVTAGNYLVGNGTSALTEKTPNIAANDLINALSTGDATPTGEDYYVAQFAGGGTTTKTYHRRPVKALWEYIKAQISSVLGLTATSYGGNAATATTAQNFDTSTGTIKTALDGKRDIYGDFYGEGTSIYGWKIGQMALGTGGSANGYMTAIVRIDRWTKLDNGDRDFDSFFGVVKLWARNSSDGTTTSTKASIHSFKPTAFSSTSRGYAIFKKSSNSGHTIDWYIGLAPDSDSTYTPKKEIAYSLIEISPMYEVNFTRGLERVSSDPGFDSWMQNCTRGPWLAHDQYGAGSSSLPVYVDADNKVVGVDPKLTQGNLIRSLDTWSNINETDEYVPAANNSATAQYPHGRYSFARIWAWIKGKLTSDSGVDISGNAATASDAKSGSTLATTLSGKAPTNHASSSDTYGKGTESKYGHVKLDNSALSASSTNTDGVACGKGHTHSQYLTSHQSISGKMNTSADNAASGALQNLTAQLNEGTNAFTDGTELFSSYAGNSGFATTGYVNKPYRRKASAMWSYINSKLVLERNPADVGTSHKRIQLGYGSYGSGVAGYCCYLVHIFFNFVGGTLAGKGVTVLVSYDWRTTTYQSPKCQVLNDNFFSDTGYRIVLANFLSDNNTKLHICLGLVNTSAPTTLVGFAYSYCKIMRVGYGLNWTENIASDDVGTYNYLVQSTYFMETDTNNKIKVVTALPSSPDPNTIYFV